MSKKKNEPISAEDLFKRLRSDTSLFILDVRNEEDYKSWRIEDIETPETLNVPYIDFIEVPEEALLKVPKDRKVVALCGKGGASDYVADILRKKGYNAVNVTGGMKAWGLVYSRATAWRGGSLKVMQFNRVGKGCLSYIIVSGSEAAVIDPARHIDHYLSFLEDEGLTLKYIFDTHLHADHISGAAALSTATGAGYHLSAGDMDGASAPYLALKDEQQFIIGSSSIQIVALSSPGHTPGSTCIMLDDKVLFTGDTLFISSMGRPDLGGQAAIWVKDLFRSISRLRKLPGKTLILPSHTKGGKDYDRNGVVSRSLDELRKSNPLMTVEDEEEFSGQVLKNLPEEPAAYQKMRKANLGLLEADEEKMEQWELGKNRCAIEQAKERI
ncbi:MBL-fold metallo-hydrolase superfamily [hydrothermal vent metagenome]|uniref:MBL-fold metallo-hydrolase superfamily n=1 Tax=hydrothermal vent metagenome TaxID=652676 RepID=A0A3B1C1L0_9ZZZZ